MSANSDAVAHGAGMSAKSDAAAYGSFAESSVLDFCANVVSLQEFRESVESQREQYDHLLSRLADAELDTVPAGVITERQIRAEERELEAAAREMEQEIEHALEVVRRENVRTLPKPGRFRSASLRAIVNTTSSRTVGAVRTGKGALRTVWTLAASKEDAMVDTILSQDAPPDATAPHPRLRPMTLPAYEYAACGGRSCA